VVHALPGSWGGASQHAAHGHVLHAVPRQDAAPIRGGESARAPPPCTRKHQVPKIGDAELRIVHRVLAKRIRMRDFWLPNEPWVLDDLEGIERRSARE